jgi:hypothetical protein
MASHSEREQGDERAALRAPIGVGSTLLVAALCAAAACKGGGTEASRDPSERKHVTVEDCSVWVEHGATTLMHSIDTALATCPADSRDATRSKFALDPVLLRSAGDSVCKSHLGQEYAVGDAHCYVSANDALALDGCKFGPMTSPHDMPWPQVAGMIRQTCMTGKMPSGTVIGGSPSAAPDAQAPAASPKP